MKTVFMFSGQGSQYFEMGRALFDQNRLFRDCMMSLDCVTQDLCGYSIIGELYFAGKRKAMPFSRTLLTHPAIFMVEYSLAHSLIESGLAPDLVLGASMGSFAAAAIAGFLERDVALEAVTKQAMAFEENCEVGGMIAVLDDPVRFEEGFLRANGELVAVNFSQHFVVSALQAPLSQMETGLRKRNLAYQRLPVSVAFHSQWIDGARDAFEACSRRIRYRKGVVALICCDRAAIVSAIDTNYLWAAARNPIRFREAVSALESWGEYRYIDVGPSGTLATFLKYLLPASSRSTTHTIVTPFGDDLRNLATLTSLGGRQLSSTRF
jgi:bacillaene synthase trans-acting acyltransferase